jgi:hypothetical protein
MPSVAHFSSSHACSSFVCCFAHTDNSTEQLQHSVGCSMCSRVVVTVIIRCLTMIEVIAVSCLDFTTRSWHYRYQDRKSVRVHCTSNPHDRGRRILQLLYTLAVVLPASQIVYIVKPQYKEDHCQFFPAS